jgi:hypothetical protein
MSLVLHAGAEQATMEQVAAVITPGATETWQPISHTDLIEQTVTRFAGLGWQVAAEQHGLWRGGARYFGVFDLKGNGLDGQDYTLSVGLANSHDRSLAAKIAVGSRVFVCDNLAFSGEVQVSRKHTTHLFRALPQVIASAVAKVASLKESQDRRISAYRETEINDVMVHDVLVRALDRNIIPARELPRVRDEWRKARHPEFEARNLWSAFNAFTQVMKGTSPVELPARTMRLHELCDRIAGDRLTFTPDQVLTMQDEQKN